MTAIPSPSEFFHAHLGQFLLTPDEITGDVVADAARALSKNYPMSTTDRDRLLRKLGDIRSGTEKKSTVPEWAKGAAKWQAGQDLVDAPELTNAERDVLKTACAGVVPKAAMGGTRLSTLNMAIVREDRPSLLRASVQVPYPERIDLQPCCPTPSYSSLLRDFYQSPPDGMFMLLEFDKTPTKPEDLVLNLSARHIHTNGGMVDSRRLRAAREATRGIKWDTIWKIGKAVARRETEISEILKIDAEIDGLAEGLSINVYDLIEALPAVGGATWNVLRLLSQDTPDDESCED